MAYSYGNPTNRVRAAEMLRKLLPRVTESIEKSNGNSGEMKPTSEIGKQSLKWYRVECCIGVHIYQGDKGGWFSDLAFKDLPAGIPAVFGTPSIHPHRSREEAIDAAVAMLALISNRPAPEVAPEDAKVVFEFDELSIIVPSGVIAEINQIPVEWPSVEYVKQRLVQIRDQFAGGKPFNTEIMDSLSPEDQRVVFSVCAMALVIGMPRFPSKPESEPPPPKNKMS